MGSVRFKGFGLLVAGMVTFGFGTEAAADVWYVDVANTSGTQTGATWGDAFTEIQPAIDAAHADGGGEVWVAQGVYAEERRHLQEGVPTGSLELKPGVLLYGGFAGNEGTRHKRDWEANITTISGKTARNGEPAFHVVFGASGVRLDGFRVEGGYADWVEMGTLRAGGGVICQSVTMTIANCIISGNGTGEGGAGGGIYCRGSDVTIENCKVVGNTTLSSGGGISFIRCPDSTVIDTVVEGNRARERGGGVQCFGSSPSFLRCTVKNNGVFARICG